MEDNENGISHRFEALMHLESQTGDVQTTIRVLGVSQSMYYAWRNRSRQMPDYIYFSVMAHLALGSAGLGFPSNSIRALLQ